MDGERRAKYQSKFIANDLTPPNSSELNPFECHIREAMLEKYKCIQKGKIDMNTEPCIS